MKSRRWIRKSKNCRHATECIILQQMLNIRICLRAKLVGCIDLDLACKTSTIEQMKNLETTEGWMLKLVKDHENQKSFI